MKTHRSPISGQNDCFLLGRQPKEVAFRISFLLFSLAMVLLGCGLDSLAAQAPYKLPDAVETRWSSFENPTGQKGIGGQTNGERKGRAALPLKAGDSLTLAEVRGSSGTVQRDWTSLSDRSSAMLRDLKIEMFLDGAARPAVRAPLGDFVGAGLGRMIAFEPDSLPAPKTRVSTFLCRCLFPRR